MIAIRQLCLAVFALLLAAGGLRAQAGDADTLLEVLPKSPAFVRDGDALFLKSAQDQKFRVTGVDGDLRPSIRVGDSEIFVDLKVIERDHFAALDHVSDLLARAQKAEVGLAGIRLGWSLLAGPHLITSDHLIVKDAVLKAEAASDRADVDAELKAAVAKLKAMVESWGSPLARKAVKHLISRLPRHATSDDDDHVTPALARRVVENGWLRNYLGEAQEVKAVEAAVAASLRPRALATFRGEGREYQLLKDTFGRRLWVYRQPEMTTWAADAPEPDYARNAPSVKVIVKIAAGADPASAKILEAVAYVEDAELVRWNHQEGLLVEENTWRAHFPAKDRRRPQVLAGYLPPHLVVPSWTGGVRMLATVHGLVLPPQVGRPSEFLDQAAKALPDAAHLDLVGEYLFSYVNDSPDTRHPGLIGYEGAMGEIHQSVEQTLATAAGGVCRGDCDDIAELYQALAQRQGRLAHIMNVPRHNALAFAAQDAKEGWRVYVLHTGPPLEFKADKLPEALAAAYRHFGSLESVDPDALPVAIRFSGENTRSMWALGWRIFLHADYATTMIDVQRDWHYHTYARGFDKMKNLVASGDDDPANYLELSGLSERTGQHGQAVGYLRKAMAFGEDPALQTRLRLLGDLYELGDRKAIERELKIVDEKINALLRRRNPAVVSSSLNFAALAIMTGKDAVAGRKFVGEHLVRFAGPQLQFMLGTLKDNPKRFEEDPGLAEMRNFVRSFVSLVAETLRLDRDAAFADENMRLAMAHAETWISDIAFSDPDTKDTPALVDSIVGDYYEAAFGRPLFEAMLEKTGKPPASRVTTARAGTAGLVQSLAWTKASPYYWAGRLTRLFDEGHATFDQQLAARLSKEFKRTLDQGHPNAQQLQQQDETRRQVEFLLALVAGDAKAIRSHLEWVAEQDDKRRRDSVATSMGQAARFMTAKSWQTALGLFDEVLHHKPSYFAVAWEAVDGDAPQRGLEAAALAVIRFPQDTAFKEEGVFMQKLFAESPGLPIGN
ncbi:MAG: hypothetical protein V3W41_00395 [Planctomycetota bacterium]